jgi:hypothetical protein
MPPPAVWEFVAVVVDVKEPPVQQFLLGLIRQNLQPKMCAHILPVRIEMLRNKPEHHRSVQSGL